MVLSVVKFGAILLAIFASCDAIDPCKSESSVIIQGRASVIASKSFLKCKHLLLKYKVPFSLIMQIRDKFCVTLRFCFAVKKLKDMGETAYRRHLMKCIVDITRVLVASGLDTKGVDLVGFFTEAQECARDMYPTDIRIFLAMYKWAHLNVL